MPERALLNHARSPSSLSGGGRPRAGQRAPPVLSKGLLVPQRQLQARSRNRSASPTAELPGPTLAPGGSQVGRGTPPEPRELLDTAPAPGSALHTQVTAGRPSAPTTAGPQASATAAGSVERHQQQEGCLCPSREPPQARPAPRPYVPTPRTEEAAWAASALTFLLVVLTLAILYTRLHRRFHKSQSLYWAPSDAGQEPVSAVLKRRLLAAPSRRKKRPRPQQRQLLLQEGSSESSD
ncbi:tumor protein p53-inducible protein 13 isoform X1 [Carettochelys insculpta]|uniref:tumor protein p53-inducible protein 13 isoform X1 n=1 Tax=Carettochelys insculpta TaxID=44489 RepID=UPI003EB87E47